MFCMNAFIWPSFYRRQGADLYYVHTDHTGTVSVLLFCQEFWTWLIVARCLVILSLVSGFVTLFAYESFFIILFLREIYNKIKTTSHFCFLTSPSPKTSFLIKIDAFVFNFHLFWCPTQNGKQFKNILLLFLSYPVRIKIIFAECEILSFGSWPDANIN